MSYITKWNMIRSFKMWNILMDIPNMFLNPDLFKYSGKCSWILESEIHSEKALFSLSCLGQTLFLKHCSTLYLFYIYYFDFAVEFCQNNLKFGKFDVLSKLNLTIVVAIIFHIYDFRERHFWRIDISCFHTGRTNQLVKPKLFCIELMYNSLLYVNEISSCW